MKRLNGIDPSDQLAPLKILLIVFGLLLGHGTVQWSARSPYTPTIRLRIPQFFSYSFSVRFLFEKTNKKGRCWPTKMSQLVYPPLKSCQLFSIFCWGTARHGRHRSSLFTCQKLKRIPFKKLIHFLPLPFCLKNLF